MRAATNADREDGRSRIAGSERRRRRGDTPRRVPGAFSATFYDVSADTSLPLFFFPVSHAGILSGNIARGRFGSAFRLEAGSSPPRGEAEEEGGDGTRVCSARDGAVGRWEAGGKRRRVRSAGAANIAFRV